VPIFIAPFLLLALGLWFAKVVRSGSLALEPTKLRCLNLLALFSVAPSLLTSVALDARWSLGNIVASESRAFALGLVLTALLAGGFSLTTRAAVQARWVGRTVDALLLAAAVLFALSVLALTFLRSSMFLPLGGVWVLGPSLLSFLAFAAAVALTRQTLDDLGKPASSGRRKVDARVRSLG
jgi:hypothetical protein